MLPVLGIDVPSAALLRELEAPAAGRVVEPFPDVRQVLDELRAEAIGLSVVSDSADVAVDHQRSVVAETTSTPDQTPR
jgi:beta-phosphoglucomutase-like phosphatase (HAD superfamily)